MNVSHLLDPAAASFLMQPHRNLVGDRCQDALAGSMMETRLGGKECCIHNRSGATVMGLFS